MRAGLLGREADIASLMGLLDQGERAVTLLGPGGVGKTRLARALAEQHPHASFCELHAHRDAQEMAGAVARSLGMVLRSGDPVQELARLLQTKGPCLLILDNLEQLLTEGSQALGAWLKAAPGLRLVLTSQRRLGLEEEYILPVEPLSVEAGCALFLVRARAGGVRLSADEVRPLVEALDRLPLALELAAARCRVMSPQEILSRLSERFQLLSGRRHGPARHASLQATLAWTWALLTPLQQQVLSQLALFQGRFGLQDAETILELPAGQYAPDVLAELVDFSLVQPAPQMQLFISVRDFALARLSEPEQARWRHARWVASFAAEQHPAQRLSARRNKSVELMADAELALSWSLSKADPLAGECALVVSAIREQAGPQQGIGEALSRCLAMEGLTPWTRLRLSIQVSQGHRYAGQLPEFGAALDQSERLAEPLGPVAVATVGLSRAIYHWYSGDMPAARRRCEDALASLASNPELGTLRGRLMGLLANMCNQLGDVAVARETYRAALAVAVDPSEQAVLNGNLGLLEVEDGRLGPAELFLKRSIEAAREMDFRALESVMLGNLALCRSMQGEQGEACALLTRAAEMSTDIGDLRSLRYQRAALAEIQLELGELSSAGDHLDFLRQDLEREGNIEALVRSLYLEWLAKTGAVEAAQDAVDEVLAAAESNGLLSLEGAIYARVARLIREGLLRGDAAGLLGQAQAIAKRLNARSSSDLSRAIARAQAQGGPTQLAAEDLSWVLGESGQVDLRRRPLMRRLLAPLRGGDAVATAALLEAGWPDSKLAPDRLAPRLYSALHELRRLGVHVESAEGQYRLRSPSEA